MAYTKINPDVVSMEPQHVIDRLQHALEKGPYHYDYRGDAPERVVITWTSVRDTDLAVALAALSALHAGRYVSKTPTAMAAAADRMEGALG